MKLEKLNKNKGVAGLNVFLSVITMLFMIGLIVMVYVVASGRLEVAVDEKGTYNAQQDNALVTDDAGLLLTECSAARGSTSATITTALNSSNSSMFINEGNWTVTGCLVRTTPTAGVWNNSNWNITYSYQASVNIESVDVINDTGNAIGTVTDWFGIIIVLAALVVIILMVVIIINSIRGSGMLGNEGA